MTRLVLVALALMACGTDPPAPVDRHAPGTCDKTWTNNGFTDCEEGCSDSRPALLASGPACDAVTAEGKSVSCSKTFVFGGITGCCTSDDTALHFADCQ